jgi:NAD(P)-dependent dehydrogenase (short-subunit alcohol dehydrogenase family)
MSSLLGVLVPVALITGASRGLGRAVARNLAEAGWSLVIDGRDAAALDAAANDVRVAGAEAVVAVPGDVADDRHRAALSDEVEVLGSLDLLVNNASLLGPSPQPALADYPLSTFERVYTVNTFAPLALTQRLLPRLRASSGAVVNVTSDAAVEPYDGWGGYGSSKAALEQWTAILAAEESAVRVYALDPGDMRTRMQQEAFPDEDISDRAEPETVAPAVLRLLQLPSGRYRAATVLGDESADSGLGATA